MDSTIWRRELASIGGFLAVSVADVYTMKDHMIISICDMLLLGIIFVPIILYSPLEIKWRYEDFSRY